MTDQSKTPGAMVPTTVPQKLWQLQVFLDAAGLHDQSKIAFAAIQQLAADHAEDARAMVEQTPAVGREPEVWTAECPDNPDASIDVVSYSDHRAHVATLRAEIERLNGMRPEWPPRPPDGSGLPRYGLRWNGPQQPLSVPMDDGYWTPWHLADQLKTRVSEFERALGGMLFAFDDGLGRDWSEPLLNYARQQCRAIEYVDPSATSKYVVESHMDDPKPMCN